MGNPAQARRLLTTAVILGGSTILAPIGCGTVDDHLWDQVGNFGGSSAAASFGGGSQAGGASGRGGHGGSTGKGGVGGVGAHGGVAGSGIAGSGVAGTGVAGSGVAGSGVAGSGVAGTGVAGSGVAGSGIAGSGVAGSGIAGSGIAGSGVAGTGVAGSGIAGSGVAGSGVAGSGIAGSGVAGSGVAGSGVAGSGVGGHGGFGGTGTAGSGVAGSEAAGHGGFGGSGVAGSGVAGSGVAGSGVAGSGVAGSGVAGSGVAGSGVAGSGVAGSGVAGSGVAGSGAGGVHDGGTPGGFGGTSIGCGQDPNMDADGDGWTPAEGDCNDCDHSVNPGAYDFINFVPGPDGGATSIPLPDDEQIDEDCNDHARLAHEDIACDSTLGPDALSPYDAARSMGLCQVQVPENPAQKKDKRWGVISASFSAISGPFLTTPVPASQKPQNLNFGLLPSFGPATVPFEGHRLFALSTGQARAPGQPSFLPELETQFDKGYSSSYPDGFPKNGTCGTTGEPHDGVALDLRIRVPTNAHSFSFQFRFFTYEFPVYTCQVYNDVFAVIMDPYPLPKTDPMWPDIAFESQANGTRNVIGVNNQSFLTACDPVVAGYDNCVGSGDLKGSGFEGHAASGWLRSLSPAVAGDVINLRFAIWDSTDGIFDSTVVVDDFRWRGDTGSLHTGLEDAGP